MSKFTTEVRYICQTYANVTTGTTLTIDQTILAAIPYIFTDDWTTQNADHKEELCKKILRHYYMREIGAETVGLWKLQLNSLLSEIMPKYNALYSNLENIKTKLLLNADVTETRNLTNNSTSKADTSNTTSSTGSTTTTSTGTSKNTASADSNNDAWQEYSDTPQGALSGIENQTYLTNATRNRATNSSSSTSDATANNSGSTTTKDDATTTGTSTGSNDTTENYTLTITGKNSGASYIDEYLKLEQGYNDIDQMIINDLAPCFMALWE